MSGSYEAGSEGAGRIAGFREFDLPLCPSTGSMLASPHDDQASFPFGARADRFPGSFGANNKAISVARQSKPLGCRPSSLGAVWAGDTLYVSGWLDPDMKTHSDTTSQTVSLLKDVQKFLESQKTNAGGCGDDACLPGGRSCERREDGLCRNDGRIFPIFRHQGQPNKPARTTVQVVLPAGARGV